MNTAPAIHTAAAEYNRGYDDFPGSAGVATIDVAALFVDNGRSVRVVVTPVVIDADGGSWAAADPVATVIPRRDGRLSAPEHAAKAARRLGFAGVEVPVRYRNLSR